ncbi:MAG TPA: IS701 family transposase [Gemmataceae bacterium]|nr:IS701 family transposase [Gemmataceae bacterium]
MDLQASGDSEARFAAYINGLVEVIGHVDRVRPLRDYCVGLVMPGERKSVEPMAAVTAPGRVSAQHQSLLHFVASAPWSDEAVLGRVREMVLPQIERHGPIEAWILDDTGFPKKGRHSVGVARQYCGQLGKQDNCQAAVSLSIANHHASLPVAWRLYLPESWAGDEARRAAAKIPKEITFKTKPQIALEQIETAYRQGLPRGVVLMDAGYGNDSALRAGVTALKLPYVAGIQSNVLVWPPGIEPLPPKPWSGRGKVPKRAQRESGHEPVSAKQLALSLPQEAWQIAAWREGTNDTLSSRFARIRLSVARRDDQPGALGPLEWLIIEWPESEAEPTKYWLSTLTEDISLEHLVDSAKLRWRIERDYQDLKQELGLGHYEGRGWRGFHHHATLCIAAYGFLISERETIPPSAPDSAKTLKIPGIPQGYRPRGAADPAHAPHPQLNHNRPKAPHRRTGPQPTQMPVLCSTDPTTLSVEKFMTQ